jgi:hypothetical protein
VKDPNLERALSLIDEATAGITDAELAWHPEGKWPPAMILEHLSMTFSATANGMNRILGKEKLVCRARRPKELVAQFVTTGLGIIPGGRTAPKQATPAGTMTGRQAMREIRENLTAMDSAIAACKEKFGTPQKFSEHPILGPLSLAQWTKFHYVHTRHHMKQVRERRARASAAFSEGDQK